MKPNFIIDKAFECVKSICKRYNIDESHAMYHSMTVLNNAKTLYNNLKLENSFLEEKHLLIICVSAIVHDMCDHKYMDVMLGVSEIRSYLTSDYISNHDFEIISDIILHMSYSYVKRMGFFSFTDPAQTMAYNIVREADMLASYDFDRCVIYGVYMSNYSYSMSVEMAVNLFEMRMMTYLDDNMFTFEFSKSQARILHVKAEGVLESLKKMKTE